MPFICEAVRGQKEQKNVKYNLRRNIAGNWRQTGNVRIFPAALTVCTGSKAGWKSDDGNKQ
jgi:hypothetical protein